jgi:hypothetical protein
METPSVKREFAMSQSSTRDQGSIAELVAMIASNVILLLMLAA